MTSWNGGTSRMPFSCSPNRAANAAEWLFKRSRRCSSFFQRKIVRWPIWAVAFLLLSGRRSSCQSPFHNDNVGQGFLSPRFLGQGSNIHKGENSVVDYSATSPTQQKTQTEGNGSSTWIITGAAAAVFVGTIPALVYGIGLLPRRSSVSPENESCSSSFHSSPESIDVEAVDKSVFCPCHEIEPQRILPDSLPAAFAEPAAYSDSRKETTRGIRKWRRTILGRHGQRERHSSSPRNVSPSRDRGGVEVCGTAPHSLGKRRTRYKRRLLLGSILAAPRFGSSGESNHRKVHASTDGVETAVRPVHEAATTRTEAPGNALGELPHAFSLRTSIPPPRLSSRGDGGHHLMEAQLTDLSSEIDDYFNDVEIESVPSHVLLASHSSMLESFGRDDDAEADDEACEEEAGGSRRSTSVPLTEQLVSSDTRPRLRTPAATRGLDGSGAVPVEDDLNSDPYWDGKEELPL